MSYRANSEKNLERMLKTILLFTFLVLQNNLSRVETLKL